MWFATLGILGACLTLHRIGLADMSADEAARGKEFCSANNLAEISGCDKVQSYYTQRQLTLMWGAFSGKIPVSRALSELRTIAGDNQLTFGVRIGAESALESLSKWDGKTPTDGSGASTQGASSEKTKSRKTGRRRLLDSPLDSPDDRAARSATDDSRPETSSERAATGRRANGASSDGLWTSSMDPSGELGGSASDPFWAVDRERQATKIVAAKTSARKRDRGVGFLALGTPSLQRGVIRPPSSSRRPNVINIGGEQ